MTKKKTLTMWALWNFDRMMGVKDLRRQVRDYADKDITGDPAKTRQMLKSGALKITKVAVREI